MRRGMLIVLCLLAVGMSVLAWRNADRLPPRRPYKIARVISGLPIPRDSRVLEFRDTWSGIDGDGDVRLVVQFTAMQFEEIARSANGRGYRNLDSGGPDRRVIAALVGPPVHGLYRLSGSLTDDYELVVLDSGTDRMYVLAASQ